MEEIIQNIFLELKSHLYDEIKKYYNNILKIKKSH